MPKAQNQVHTRAQMGEITMHILLRLSAFSCYS